jgi:hypothetical protein
MATKTYYASDMLKDTTITKKPTLSDVTKGTIFGAGCGVAGGLLYAKFHDKNYAKSAFIGMLIGGIISKIFI